MDPEDDLRSDIESAIDTSEVNEGVVDTTPEPDAPAPQVPDPTANAVDTKPDDGKGAPVRDSMGRFIPKTEKAVAAPGAIAAAPGTPGSPAAAIGQPAPGQPAVVAPAGVTQPPASFSFGAKEAWAQTPPVVQQEVARREQQMQQWANSTAPARQLGERFHQAVQPFLPAIQAEGVDPLTAVTNLLQFGTRMRMGTPAEKAGTLAQIATIYGVDLQALDHALAGLPPPPSVQGVDPGYVNNAVQQALAPLYRAAQQRQYAVQQQVDGQARSEIEAFAADPKHKYFDHLRNQMADLIEVAKKHGVDLSIADAYERAGMLHPEISKLMIAQRQGASAHQLTAAAQRAKAAAVSVNGSAPIGNPNVAEPTSIRESIEAAIEAHSRY